jgi:DNA-binding XRE family transcriptional regulator
MIPPGISPISLFNEIDTAQYDSVTDTLPYIGISAIKLSMFNNNIDIESLLKQLGQRLKEARLARNESQELFAQRLGLTRQSYSRMEKGSPQTLIGNWLAASSILGRLDDWKDVLAEKKDLFASFEKKSSKRQRAGGKRKRKI